MRITKKQRFLSVALLLALSATFLAGCAQPGPSALLKSEKLLQDGKPKEALRKLLGVRAVMESEPQYWNFLGMAYHGSGDPENAIKAYQSALALDANLTAVHFNLGQLYMEQNNLFPAVEELNKFIVLTRPSTPPEAWVKLGTAYLRMKRFDYAEQSFQESRKEEPRHAEALNGLGLVYLGRNRPREAAQFFQETLKNSPDYAPALLNLAVLHHQYLDQKDVARERYKAYLALRPKPPNYDSVQATLKQLDRELKPSTAIVAKKKPATPPPPASLPLAPTNAPQVTTTPLPAKKVEPSSPATNTPPLTLKTNSVATVIHPINLPGTTATNVAAPPPKPKVETNAPKQVASAPRLNSPKAQPTTAPVKPVEKPAPPPEKPEVKTKPPDSPPVETKPAAPVETASAVPATPRPDPVPSEEKTEGPPKPTSKDLPDLDWKDKINPKNWFTKKIKEAPTPLPGETGQPTESQEPPKSPEPSTPPAAVLTPLPSRPKPTFPRYSYHRPRKATAGNRREAEKHFDDGYKAYQEGRFPEACAAYRRSATQDPTFFEAHYNLGLAAYEVGDIELALVAYEAALALKPADSRARYNFALVLKQGQFLEDAANELQKVLNDFPSDARAHLVLANIYAQHLEDTPRARAHYQKLLELQPKHTDAPSIRNWLQANP